MNDMSVMYYLDWEGVKISWGGGGWRYRSDIFTPGENIGGWKYRITWESIMEVDQLPSSTVGL